MAKSKATQREEQRNLTRRALIKWSVAAGAALGVSRSNVFEILGKTADKNLAYAAADNAVARSVHLIAGNGGLAWFQLLWPQVEVAMAGSNTFAWHKPGEATMIAGTARPLAIGPDTPWTSLPASKQVTGFICGANQTHTRQPTSVTGLNGANIFSIASALQASVPSVIPIVAIGGADVGTAPGAARPAAVGNAEGIVDLFNSAASRAGGLLSQTTDAQLYKAHYDAFIQLNRASNRSTTKASYTTGQGAAQFLGTNLSAALSITPADLTRYGISGATRGNVAAIGRAFIIAVKAFKMGLTNSIVLPAMNDDPHGAFADGSVNTVPGQLKGVFDGFMADLIATTDDNTLKALADDTVITICGDTSKNPLQRGGWPDGTPGNTNQVFVFGAGHLKTGWFGQVRANGQVEGFNGDGSTATYNGANTARTALASIAYAIAKRDDRAISTFANGIDIKGTTIPKEL